MTNEEAIGYNKNLREYMRITDKYNPEYKFLKENYEALDMAIKALEQEPTTKNDLGVDCISRKQAIDAFPDLLPNIGYNKKAITEILKELPSVTPQEPNIGHWVGHREHCENLGVMPSGLGAYEWCSNCGCGIDVREWHRNNYNYCPNCGARMRESEEE